jgi:hypothetical protein
VPTSLTLTFRVENSAAPISLTEQGPLLEPLLARFLQDHPNTPRRIDPARRCHHWEGALPNLLLAGFTLP